MKVRTLSTSQRQDEGDYAGVQQYQCHPQYWLSKPPSIGDSVGPSIVPADAQATY